MADAPAQLSSTAAPTAAATAIAAPAAAPATRPAGTLSGLKIDRGAPLKRRRRRWPWVLVALLIAGAAAALLVPRKTEVQASAVLAAYPSQQYADLTASGYVVAQRRAAVASKGTGRLVELLVREGSAVKQGDLIGRLDASDVQAAVAASQSGVLQAQAARVQTEAALGQGQAELENAQVELKRQQDLAAQGFISPQAVDGALRRLAVARSVLASQQATVAAAQAGIGLSRAQLRMQQVNQTNTEIRAPFDGVVLIKNANVGDMITPFSSASGTSGAVVTMADMRTLEVEADVSESNVARIKPEQPVEITLDALPEMRFRGNVSRIVPTVDRAKATVMTKIRFEALDPRILPEMSAKVSFLTRPASAEDQKPVIAVNPKAIAERDGKKLVFRLAGDSVEAVPVTLGRKIGDLQEVAGGLKPGERVVLSPAEALKAGARVTVTAK
jgi:RND family efflux transporter MFP subunit